MNKILLYGIADLLAVIVLFIAIFLKYGTRRKCSKTFSGLSELPDSMTPAEVNSYIFKSSDDIRSITATIMELARLGYIQFETIIKKQGIFKKVNTAINIKIVRGANLNLKKHERLLLNFLNQVYTGGYTIESYMNENPDGVFSFLNDFKEAIKETIRDEYSIYWEEAPWKAKTLLLIASVLNVFIAAINCINKNYIILITLVPAIILTTFGAVSLRRKSQQGINSECGWKAFRECLKNFSKSKGEELPEIALWEHYISYAAAFGLSKQVIKQIKAEYPDVKKEYYGTWYNYFGYMYGDSKAIESIDTLNTFIDNLYRIWDSAASGKK